MKIFVKNDSKKECYNSVINRLNSYKNVIEKLQNTLKILQKNYKVVISISLWRSTGIHRTVRVYVLSGAPCQYIRPKELRLGSLELRLVAWAATIQRELRFKGSYA